MTRKPPSMVEECKGTELLFHQCECVEGLLHQFRATGCSIAAYAPCRMTKVLPLVADSDKKITCVGCILLY